MKRHPDITELKLPYERVYPQLKKLHAQYDEIYQRRLSRQVFETYQTEALTAMVSHAYQTCPYYTEMFDQHGLRPQMIRTLNDLKQIPLLSRQTVRQNFYDLCSDTIEIQHSFLQQTSGSTGEPVKIISNYQQKLEGDIVLSLFIRSYGVEVSHFSNNDTGLILVTSFPMSQSFTYRQPFFNFSTLFKLNINGEHWSSASDPLEFIRQQQPILITGLPEHLYSLYQLSHQMDPEQIYPIKPRLLLSGGNTLRKSIRDKLRNFFQVPVVDFYASKEFGQIAATCPENTGYHINEWMILEIVDANGEPLPAGERGQIALTSLRNFSMPLIRYVVGDYGRLAPNSCSCGNQWPLLLELEGRSNQFLIKPDGTLLHPYVFLKLLNRLSLAQYQVIQQSQNQIVIRYILDQEFDPMIETQIRECVQPFLKGFNLLIEQVPSIGEPNQKVHNFISLLDEPVLV